MITENIDMTDFLPEKKHIDVSMGESVRIVREMNELTLPQLATITGISKATLRAIEADRLELTLEQATVLAKALQVTPAILMATGSDASNKSAA